MTPDEVISNAQKLGLIAIFHSDILSPEEKLALKSAITLLQDYQKLRERIDTHKITCIISGLEFKDGEKDTIIYDHYKDTAQAIVTYLQQPTEH